LKFTFGVNININSYYMKEIIFNVNSVIQSHGKQKEPVYKLSVAPQIQESPSTAMERLSTGDRTSLVGFHRPPSGIFKNTMFSNYNVIHYLKHSYLTPAIGT
jgi:hypothetical protein